MHFVLVWKRQKRRKGKKKKNHVWTVAKRRAKNLDEQKNSVNQKKKAPAQDPQNKDQ